MAHFAELDDNNIVLGVMVISNEDILDENGEESESIGIKLCKDLYGDKKWVQTSYSKSFRKNYASIGFFYDEERDAFIPPQYEPGFVLQESTCTWVPPLPYPQDGKDYFWNNTTNLWTEVD